MLAKLGEAHKATGYGCSAAGEGLPCCLDILTEDPAAYDPARVTEARALFTRYRQQLAGKS